MYVVYLDLSKWLSMTTHKAGYDYPSNTMYPYTPSIWELSYNTPLHVGLHFDVNIKSGKYRIFDDMRLVVSSALQIFDYAHANYPRRLHYLVSKNDEPLPDKYHDTSTLRRRLVSNFVHVWMGNKVERKPGNDRRWKVQSTCFGAWMCLRRYLSNYPTATLSWWSFFGES